MTPSSRWPWLAGSALLVAGLMGGVVGSVLTLNLRPAAKLPPLVLHEAVQTPPPDSSTPSPAANGIPDIVNAMNPAVVTISASPAETAATKGRGTGTGSGFIIDAQGHILTNNHVAGSSSRLVVVLSDGSSYPAQLLGSDPQGDLAVLQASLPPGHFSVATLGDSDAARVGETAIAIGTPFNFDHSVTLGIISGLDRTFSAGRGRPLQGLLQTDAAINPGNSGGPLLNARGEVIGINTAIESDTGANAGIGFAIPINTAKRLLPELVAGVRVTHAYLGISGTVITDSVANDLRLSRTQGVLVDEVVAGGPGAKAGLKAGTQQDRSAGDIIVGVDGRTVKSVAEMSQYLDSKKPGQAVTLLVVRAGKEQTLVVTLGEWPNSQPS